MTNENLFSDLACRTYLILYKYNDLYNSPSESQSFGTIFFRFIWEKTKKDIILCRQKIILSNGVMAAQQILGPVCPSSNLGRTTRKPRYSIRVARLSCFLSLAFGCSGDLHLETSPYTYLGFHRNLSSEPIHEHLANGKPQSGPLHVIVLFEIA